MVALTIGMPTYNDFDGVYFTVQALRLYQDLDDVEILVVDNFGCDHTRQFVEGSGAGRYVLATEAVGTAAAKNRVFAEARGEAVLCCDSHVMFPPGVITRLKSYYQDHPASRDLLQGPIVYDDLATISTHFDPVWRGQMWGIWATDPRGLDPEGEPFAIPMQGMGVFSCLKATWPGFNSQFRGFGGEEGYIHEKVRQQGGRCLCLPWLRWMHRFGRPAGVPYPLSVEDKFRNYLIGFTELGLDTAPIWGHFRDRIPEDRMLGIARDATVTPAITPVPAPVACTSPGHDPAPPQAPPETARVFTDIYQRNLWGAATVSGPGSTREATARIRDELGALFAQLDIRILADAACGDASWITLMTDHLDYYFGFDVVEDLIVQNMRTIQRTNHFFRTADIATDILPRADAILCRDCLGHLPSSLGRAAIDNFRRSGSGYLLATTFPTVRENGEVSVGGWWPLNLTAPPYDLPHPVCYLRERAIDPNDPYNDKSLGVWRLADL